jgi:hypothetical protein
MIGSQATKSGGSIVLWAALVGDAFKVVRPLGSGTFTKVKTGQADTFDLKPDDGGRTYLRDQLKAGGAIVIVVFKDDEEVAATYFGVGSELEGNRPRLVIETRAGR